MPRPQKILFLHPKTLVDSWPFPVDTLGEVIKAPSAVYPTLAATLRDLPLEVCVFDGYVTRETFVDYKRRLASADVIAISMMSPLKALDTEVTIRLAKRLNPGVKILLGGNHATAFAERWVEDVGVDAVVSGEAELALPQLLERWAAGAPVDDVMNLTYCDGGVAKRTLVPAPSVDLDETPLPAWGFVDLLPYHLGLVRRGACATIEMSRGCPHRCDFCNINTYWNFKQRFKSPERVLEEMERLHRRGVREFIFADDNFAQDHRTTCRVLEGMIERDFGFRFGCFLRGDTVKRHPEFVELAARAGMRFGLMGIETLDDDWLGDHRKGVRSSALEMYSEVYARLRSAGIFLFGLFITPQDADPSYVSGSDADGRVCDFHYTADLVALRGSQLFEKLSARGAVAKDMFHHDWNMPSIRNEGGIQVSRKGMMNSSREFSGAYAIRSLFSPQRFRRRVWWRHLGIVGERLLCTTAADLKRRRLSKDHARCLEERHAELVATATRPEFIEELARRSRWRSPLSLRTGLWSAGAPVYRPAESS